MDRAVGLWDDLLHSRAFWLGFMSAGASFPIRRDSSERGLRAGLLGPAWHLGLSFLFPGRFLLRFDVYEDEHRLGLSRDDDGMHLGSMDSHQMSDLLRWDEFERITRRMAEDGGPAWACELLLSSYLAVTEDIADRLLALLPQSLEESGVFDREEIDGIAAHVRKFWVRRGLRWSEVSGLGWVAEGGDSYSLRRPGGDFNFPLFLEFLAAVGDPSR